MNKLWTNPNLERLRNVGDPEVDELVVRIAAEDGAASIPNLLAMLLNGEAPDSEKMPEIAREYLCGGDPLPPGTDLERVHKGQRLFQIYSPEILTVLCCYSLPCCYAAYDGASILKQTGQLISKPKQRIFTTARLMRGIMKPGALAEGGSARMLVHRVRFTHSVVRYVIAMKASAAGAPLHDGAPVNQEDMAGTLVSFSWVVLDGLSKLGIKLAPQQQEDFQYAWNVVGYLIGIVPELLPQSVQESKDLGYIIKARQIDRRPKHADPSVPSPGVLLTHSLLKTLQEPLPSSFEGLPATLMRHFLPQDVVAALEIPEADYTKLFVQFVSAVSGRIDRLASRSKRDTGIIAWFGRVLAESLIACESEGFPSAITGQIRRTTPGLKHLGAPAAMPQQH